MMGNAVFSDSLLGGMVDTTVMDVEQFDYMTTDSAYADTYYDLSLIHISEPTRPY